MKFGVLGPLMLDNNEDTSCVPTAPKARHLLTLLMINANQIVSVDTCVDELWQSAPPRSAVSVLQTYVLQIRRLLRAADAQEILVTHNRSYQLLVPAASFDRAVFASTTGRARAAVLRTDDRVDADLFDSALNLWRGPAMADIPDGPIIAVHRIELEELRFGAMEQRGEAYLRLGRHRELLADLRALAGTYPLRENVQAQLMVALYRSGRRAEAIGTFDRLRGLMGKEFGLDPVPRMQRLYQAIRHRLYA